MHKKNISMVAILLVLVSIGAFAASANDVRGRASVRLAVQEHRATMVSEGELALRTAAVVPPSAQRVREHQYAVQTREIPVQGQGLQAMQKRQAVAQGQGLQGLQNRQAVAQGQGLQAMQKRQAVAQGQGLQGLQKRQTPAQGRPRSRR